MTLDWVVAVSFTIGSAAFLVGNVAWLGRLAGWWQ